MAERKTVDITTGIGTLSFPHVFKETATKNDKGETEYNAQIIIPKTQREDLKAILRAIKEVGEAKWGDRWKQMRKPLRDGDAEADDPVDGGGTKGEKYPERLGCYFINARSKRPIGVVDRNRIPITESGDIYAGCKVKMAVTFYPYSNNGNNGIGASLNGIQKIADGESIGGGGKPAIESMFDMLGDEDETGLDDDLDGLEDEAPAEPAKPAAKKAAAKKAATPKPEPVEVDETDDLGDDDNDEFADLED